MGNCQAIDNASIVLQTQNGRAERFYTPVSASEIMKHHPGHHVALLLTTTFYSSSSHHQPPNNHPPTTDHRLRVTRIKILRPTDNLVLGHAYRLITTQEVMKGLNAKKMKKLNGCKSFQTPEFIGMSEKSSNCEVVLGKNHQQVRKADKHRPAPVKSKSLGSKSRGWHPSLNSISEATS